MTIEIDELNFILRKILKTKGLNEFQAKIVADQYLEAELRNKKTHGIIKFLKELPFFNERLGNPVILIDKKVVVKVDAKKEIGQLAAYYCLETVISRAKKYGMACVGMINSQRYGTLDTWVRKIASEDLLGIVMNTCEPAVAITGTFTPILGTNPIAFGVPTLDKPFVFDMSTAKAPMSTLLISQVEDSLLPKRTFLDKNGIYTRKVESVRSVESFGGYKGNNLAILIEIICGSLIGAKMGLHIKNKYDAGYVFIAIDPNCFQPLIKFKKQNTIFINEMRNSKTKKGVEAVVISGETSEQIKDNNFQKGYLELPKSVIEKLRHYETV